MATAETEGNRKLHVGAEKRPHRERDQESKRCKTRESFVNVSSPFLNTTKPKIGSSLWVQQPVSSSSNVSLENNRIRRASIAATEPIIIFVKTWNGIRTPGRHNRDKCGVFSLSSSLPLPSGEWKFGCYMEFSVSHHLVWICWTCKAFWWLPLRLCGFQVVQSPKGWET